VPRDHRLSACHQEPASTSAKRPQLHAFVSGRGQTSRPFCNLSQTPRIRGCSIQQRRGHGRLETSRSPRRPSLIPGPRAADYMVSADRHRFNRTWSARPKTLHHDRPRAPALEAPCSRNLRSPQVAGLLPSRATARSASTHPLVTAADLLSAHLHLDAPCSRRGARAAPPADAFRSPQRPASSFIADVSGGNFTVIPFTRPDAEGNASNSRHSDHCPVPPLCGSSPDPRGRFSTTAGLKALR